MAVAWSKRGMISSVRPAAWWKVAGRSARALMASAGTSPSARSKIATGRSLSAMAWLGLLGYHVLLSQVVTRIDSMRMVSAEYVVKASTICSVVKHRPSG